MKLTELEDYYQQNRVHYSELFDLRIHRALSWLKKAESSSKDLDACFIALWIAFNAAYAREMEHTSTPSDRSDSQQFLYTVCRVDKSNRIYHLLWQTFSKNIRVLLDNPYTFQPFWEYHNGRTSDSAWREAFEEAKSRTNTALAKQNTGLVLSNVFARLYTLRNQIVHGGTVYNSPYTRAQLRDGCAILKQCIPLILQIMQENHTLPDWGKPFYPHVDAP